MNAECRMMNDEETPRFPGPAPIHRSSFIIHHFQRSSFTLIEMLTVIAIIGVLAAILLPTIRIAMTRAKIAAAKGDLGSIETALNMYNMEFGAYPPDNNIGDWLSPMLDSVASGSDTDRFDAMESPNECLVWFLTREYSRGDASYGRPSGYSPGFPNSGDTDNDWTAPMANPVFARAAFKGGLDPKAKQQRDDNPPPDGDGFYEFVDPWGRPYFYRAYPQYWNISLIVDQGGGTFRFTLGAVQVQDLARLIGRVRISDCLNPGNDGTFDIVETGDTWFQIANASGVDEAPADWAAIPMPPPVVSFLLHKTQTCDLYSLGPNGKTRGAARPLGGQPWNAQTAAAAWGEMWGTPGDGNDVAPDRAGNLNVEDEKDLDDVNNWSG